MQAPGSYTNSAPITGLSGTIAKAGTNTLFLGADNSYFTGTIVVSDGVLQYTNTAALGYYTSPLYSTNKGSLDLNHINTGLKNIVIAGDGFNGQGAVVNNGAGIANEGVHNLTLVGDASIGGSNRFDIYGLAGGGTLQGNGFKLTEVGPSANIINAIGETYLGDIHIVAGRLGFQGPVNMGDPLKTLTIESNATLTLYSATNTADPNGAEAKVMVLNGGAIIDSGGASNNFNGPITLVGTSNLFGLRSDLHLWDGIKGDGELVVGKSPVGGGSGTLWMDGNNTYTGPTTIKLATRLWSGPIHLWAPVR